jgi:hypothetical protein
MIEERIYYPEDLHHGVCIHCEMESDEITADGRCVDCVEEELFIEQTMKGGLDETKMSEL